MKRILICGLLFFQIQQGFSKEYTCLMAYKEETGTTELKPSDWLKKDRKRKTAVWQQANAYNLTHNLPFEYTTIKQRRDFYSWYIKTIKAKGNEVLWPTMSHYISKKLALTKSFPFSLFTSRDLKEYAYLGSQDVFDGCFEYLNTLMQNPEILTSESALEWDKTILYKEQFTWLPPIYEKIDDKTLKVIEKMAKGKGFYSLVVPKAIRFQGDITKEEVRYDYGLHILRPYFREQTP